MAAYAAAARISVRWHHRHRQGSRGDPPDIEEGDIDLLRTLVKRMAEALMDAEADANCGAAHGERRPERTNRRNGYRERARDTRTGTIELAVPKIG